MFKKLKFLALLIVALCLSTCTERESPYFQSGNVVFIHPDGSGASMWEALRLIKAGPDSVIYWDKMDEMGLYRSHQKNASNSTSHAGATAHAFGVKVHTDSYGMDRKTPIQSLSGKPHSIMIEARNAGKSIAIINSGHICEPGTGVFVASSTKRSKTDTISIQVIHSGADIILSGGEELLLPEDVTGRHGVGKRQDGRNLIAEAVELGYKVVYNREELLALPDTIGKVLGVFAVNHTFNDESEEVLAHRNLPLYNEDAPSVAEMTEVALKILQHKKKPFLMVIEEEGTDNFANKNNAKGALEALWRADEAIGVVMGFIEKTPNTLLITTADSEAGGLQIVSVKEPKRFEEPLPSMIENGAPLDGRDGKDSLPFVALTDQFGTRLRFGIAWAAYDDLGGGIIAKAHGLNAGLLQNNVDNTDIYRIMYTTLFGKRL